MAEHLSKLAQLGGGARPRGRQRGTHRVQLSDKGDQNRGWPTIFRLRKMPFPATPKKPTQRREFRVQSSVGVRPTFNNLSDRQGLSVHHDALGSQGATAITSLKSFRVSSDVPFRGVSGQAKVAPPEIHPLQPNNHTLCKSAGAPECAFG